MKWKERIGGGFHVGRIVYVSDAEYTILEETTDDIRVEHKGNDLGWFTKTIFSFTKGHAPGPEEKEYIGVLS